MSRCLVGTSNYSSCYGGTSLNLQDYINANHLGDQDSGKSIIGCVFYSCKYSSVLGISTTMSSGFINNRSGVHGYYGNLQKDHIVYMEELHGKQQMSTLLSNSQSAVHLAKECNVHSRTRHV